SAWSRGRAHIPIGGGYFRLFPLKLTLKAIGAVRREGRPVMFYTHPWEFDPEQPRINKIPAKTRMRHYVGLPRTERRLGKLLQQESFATMSEVIGSMINSPTPHQIGDSLIEA
ncbi:MAG: DUF3473 domain-containing protein, partial [Pirellulaceae bacterium]|nr:DUF3473 domain-containing protein [Pirellulaceae bacterium]